MTPWLKYTSKSLYHLQEKAQGAYRGIWSLLISQLDR